MPAPISVVIPTQNAAAVLPGAVAALMEGLEAGLLRELIVADGGSQDETEAVAEAAGAVWVPGAATWGGQVRRGCAQARGDWLLVLRAETRLQPGWTVAVGQALSEPSAAWHFRVQFDTAGLAPAWFAGYANLRAGWRGRPAAAQGLLVPQQLLASAGGYPDLPVMADLALARALAGHHRTLAAGITMPAAPYKANGWMRSGTRNLWARARFRMGVSPDRLVQGDTRSG